MSRPLVRLFRPALAAGLVLSTLPLRAEPPVEPLGGLDPVLLVAGREVDGDPQITLDRGRFRYSFASAESRDRFAADPARYEIQQEGLCARMGGTVLGNPDLFVVHGGKIYLLGSGPCRDLFVAHPEKYLPPAAPAPLSSRTSPAAREEGRRWIDKAVEALGGAARLDRLRGLRMAIDRPGGRSPLTVVLGWPDRFRQEQAFGGSPFIEAATAQAGFSSFGNQAPQPLLEVQRRNFVAELDHFALSLLAARTRPGFVAAELGYHRGANEEGAKVEVELDGESRGRLELDPSGRVTSLAFSGRNDDGEWGEIVLRYSDFRPTDGLVLPYETTATWNGEPLASRSGKVTRLELDPELPPSLFSLPAGEWAQWGGPLRSFTAPAPSPGAPELAAAWPETGPKVLWRRELGEGYSGIAIAGGRLYTLTRRGEDEVVVALDAASGATAWERAYPAPFSPAYDMSHGPGPHATPLVVAGRVFTTGATGRLHALDAASGRILWGHDLLGELGGTLRVNGYACSPLAFEDLVIVQVGGKGHGVMAFRQGDGTVAWSRQDFANSVSSPLLIDLDGETQLVVFTYGEVSGLDPRTGEMRWSHPHVTEFGLNVATPVWGADHLLFLSSAYGGGSRALRLARTPAGTQVEEVWATTRMRLHFGNAVRLGDTVYGSSGDFGPAPYQALDVKSGRILWRDRSIPRASALAVGGRLLLLDEDGTLTLATPGAEGLVVAGKASVLSSPAWTAPALAGTTLYLRDRKVILALELGSPASSTTR